MSNAGYYVPKNYRPRTGGYQSLVDATNSDVRDKRFEVRKKRNV